MARSTAAASNDDDELKAPLLVEAGFSELVSPLLTPEFGRPEEIPDCPLDDSNMVEQQEHEAATPVEDAGLFRDAPATNDNNNNNNNNNNDDDEDHDEYWFSNPHQVSAMLSNFSTSYNVVNISLVLPILEASSSSSSVKPDEDAVAAVASSLLAGMMLGQVLGGLCGDLVGPLTALRLVMLLQVAASLGSASVVVAAADSSSSSQIYWRLALWRFILGVGAGGVYPLAATLSASAGHHHQQQNLAAGSAVPNDDKSSLHRVVLTFSTQGLGFVAVPLVAVPLLYSLPHNLNVIWRIILALGSAPGISLMIWQFRTMRKHQQNDGTAEPPPITRTTTSHSLASQHGVIPPPDYVSDDENNQESDEENESVLDSLPDRPNAVWSLVTRQSQEPPSSSSSPVAVTTADPASPVTQEPQEHKGWWDSVRHEEDLARKLLGTAATWFLFDVLFYGNTLFEPVVIEAAFGPRQHTNPVHLLQRTAVDSLILTSIALPGYAVAGWVLGRKTRWCYCGLFRQSPRFVMLQGFAVMALLYLVLGLFWTKLRRFPALLVTLYGLSFFFANYGPNTTTFVLPSLVYSPECRSTFNGLSAAAGKLGALTGASLFEPAADALGDSSVMLICTVIACLALIITKLFVPQPDGINDDNHEPESPSSEEYAAPTEQPRSTAVV